MRTPTSDQLRNTIDSGQTGEKIDMPDPAAAPLGTDAEAGGSSPSAAELKLEAQSAPDGHHKHGSVPRGTLVYLALIAVVAAALVGILVLAL